MCTNVYNKATDTEADSPAELRTLLGAALVPAEGYSEIDDECCLCQVDVKASVERAGFTYTIIDGDPMDVVIDKGNEPNEWPTVPAMPLDPAP